MTRPNLRLGIAALLIVIPAVAAAPNPLNTGHRRVLPGDFHTCGTDLDGISYCWGDNSNGQLGIGTLKISKIPVPTPIQLPTGVTSYKWFTRNLGFTCSLADTGTAYCWGGNDYGQLGTGLASTNPVPFPVPVLLPENVNHFVQLTGGKYNSCGLGDNYRVYCWGDNSYGQLGNTLPQGRTFNPVPIAIPVPTGGTGYVSVDSGSNQVCALANTGQAFCWGDNTFGELGNGTVGGISFQPNPVPLPSGVDSFTQLAGNIRDMCALANTGKLYCWGDNSFGQLGNGSNLSSTSPTEVLLPDGVNRFTQITGNLYTFCALGDNSQAYCWGQNSKGKFGNGTLKSSLLPTLVSLPTGVTSYKEIRLGLYHGCAVANTDAIYCWGDNSYGQLGNGTTKGSLIPVLVNY